MTARLRYGIALAIVITLIYIQQDFVIYAGEDGLKAEEMKENIEEKETEETSGKDLFGDEEGKPAGKGEGSLGEEEKPPEEGGDQTGDGEEKPPVEEPPAEEEKPIERYEIKLPEADGNKGYYVNKPEVTIKHVSERGITKYCLIQGDKKTEEKILKEKGEKAVIEKKMFSEGKNILHVWMEDEKEGRIEEFELKKEILVDTIEPEIYMSVPKGFENWYQGQVILSVSGKDAVSGVEKISCKADGKTIGTADKDYREFTITQTSIQGKGVEVKVTAWDKAGNKSERIKHIFLDGKSPEIAVMGVKNYMITGKAADITCEVDEENILQEYYAQITWENVRGKKKQMSVNNWETDGTKKVLTQKLKKDGIYHIKFHAKDMSGHEEDKEMQIIVDKTDPVIRYAESLKGQYLKKFQWNYTPEKMFWDFTTYTYEIRLDGQLYHMGDVFDREGTHRITVKVTDAAGNKAQSAAEFVIDHTAPEIIFYNIKDGEEYEEERGFKVELKGAEDTIRQIQINGENQKITPGNRTYEYSMDTCKDYEVTVKAKDRAGNEAEKTIYFQIIPKKTFMNVITGKVKSYGDTAETKKRIQTEPSEDEKKEDAPYMKMAGIGILGILLVLGAVIVLTGRRKEIESQDKQENRESL